MKLPKELVEKWDRENNALAAQRGVVRTLPVVKRRRPFRGVDIDAVHHKKKMR